MNISSPSSAAVVCIKFGLLGLITMCTLQLGNAQLFIGSDANSLVIKSGESFSYEGLTLTPSVDFTLSNTTLSRTDATTITPSPSANYISRYFSFSNTTPAFTGTIRFSYSGATIAPLSAGSLELNIRTSASGWINVSGTDVSGSYVQATLSGSSTLNTLTLASNVAPLPLSWLDFIAVKRENDAILKWTTAFESNSKDFIVEHSTSGSWLKQGIVKAAGNSASPLTYSFTHHSPATGWNHYRLLQRDLDGGQSYSRIVSLLMDENGLQASVYPNPVVNKQFNLNLLNASEVTLFDAAGRKVISQYLKEGIHTLHAEQLPGGLYRLKVGSQVLQVIIP